LSANKPDLAAYTHFEGSHVYPEDGGTSAACPVAAGVIAALRFRLRLRLGRDRSESGAFNPRFTTVRCDRGLAVETKIDRRKEKRRLREGKTAAAEATAKIAKTSGSMYNVSSMGKQMMTLKLKPKSATLSPRSAQTKTSSRGRRQRLRRRQH
jgi:hypothetical protein